MKKLALLALCALPYAFAPAQASDLTAEPAATAYWEAPFGKTRAGKAQPSYGLRMDQVVHDQHGVQVFGLTRTPMVDFRFNASGMQGIYVRGINVATPGVMKLGVDETAMWVLGGAALVVTAMIIEAHNDDSTPAPACVTFASLNAACFAGAGLGVACCPD